MQNTQVNELIERMGGAVLVIDAVTDERETAQSIEVQPLAEVQSHIVNGDGGAALELATKTITDQSVIRALYDHPTARAYGDGSYSVHAA